MNNNYLKLVLSLSEQEFIYFFHDGNKLSAQVALEKAQHERAKSGLPSDTISVYKARRFGCIPGVKEISVAGGAHRPMPTSKFIGMPRGTETL